MKNVKKTFYTTIVLTLTSFLMKTVGVWFNVYLAGMIGSAGIGIFQLILSVYALSKTLAYGGMNLAGTRLCIENKEHIPGTVRGILFCAIILGLSTAGILFLAAEKIAALWIASAEAAISLKILALSLPFVSMSAGFNGYMTAIRKMSRYSIIQFIEQVARIVLTVFFLDRLQNRTTSRILCAITAAITISEIISFSLCALGYLWDKYKNEWKNSKPSNFLKKLARIAVPDALGAYIRSALNTVEHLLIPKGIRKAGGSTDQAFSDYGIVQGMALPILLYPSSLLGVVSSLLIPEIAESNHQKRKIQINYMINRVLQMALLFSFGAMFIMLVFAKELSISIYGNDSATYFMRLLSPLVPIMYLDMTTDGMLKGMDRQLSIMKINIFDSVICVILVSILVPKIAVEGYVATIYIAEIINFLLSFYQLSKVSKLEFKIRKNLFSPIIAGILAILLSKQFLHITEKPTLNLIFAISVGIFLYYIFLRLTGGITKEDENWLKKLIKP